MQSEVWGVYENYLRYGGGVRKMLYLKRGCTKNNPVSSNVVELLMSESTKSEGVYENILALGGGL